MTRKYLVVDDNLAFADNVAEILGDAGAEVRVVPGAVEALKELEHTRFDGVVTDMRMPGVSGAQFLKQLRSIDPGVPVVLLTAWAQDAQIDEARRLGLLAFLSKPTGTKHLINLMEHARRDACVVLIDDDHALLENLSEALAERGFTACSASSVKELGELNVKPLAALVDVRLPGTADGAAVQKVKELFPDTPLFVVTAAREFEQGGLEIVRKPFDTAKLIARLEALAQNQKAGAA